MTIVKRREDGTLFPSLRNDLLEWFDMEQMLEDSFLDKSAVRNTDLYSRIPATNIVETDERYDIHLAAPGLEKEDFHVDIDNDVLEIKVEREVETLGEEPGYTRREYDFTSFYRSFRLPDTVDIDKIKAEYVNGELRIHIPKRSKDKGRSVKEIAIT